MLKAIANEGFRLKFQKCSFATKYDKYLGYIIENNTIRLIKDNVAAIKKFPEPETRKHVRQFLGKINFNKDDIPR